MVNLKKDLVKQFTDGVTLFNKAVEKVSDIGTGSFVRIFESAVNNLTKATDTLSKIPGDFDTKIKESIDSLSKIKLKVDIPDLSLDMAEGSPMETIQKANQEIDAATGSVLNPSPEAAELAPKDTSKSFKLVNEELKKLLLNIPKLSTVVSDAIKKISEGLKTSISGGGGDGGDNTPKTGKGGSDGDRGKNKSFENLFGRDGFTFTDALKGVGFYAVINSINSLKTELDDLQASLLGLGTDTEKFSSFLGDSVQDLKGSLVDNLKNATQLYSEGFRGNNKGLLTVANRLDLTNQSTSKLLKEFPQLSMSLGMSTSEMNAFAVSIDQNAQKYGISVDKLIEGLQSLKIVEDIGALMDVLGGDFKKSFMELQAMYPAQSKSIEEFINKLFSSQEAMTALVARGGQKYITAIEQATSGRELFAAVESLSRIARTTGEQFAGQAKAVQNGISSFKVLKDTNEIFGDGIMNLGAKLNKSFEEQVTANDATAEANRDFEQSLQAAMKGIKDAFIPAASLILKILTKVAGFFSYLGDFAITPIIITFVALVKITSGVISSLQSFGLALKAASAAQATQAAGGAAAATAAARGAAAAGGAVAGRGLLALGSRFLGFLGPIGIAASLIIPIITMIAGYSKGTSDNTKKQQELQEKQLEYQRQQQDKQIKEAPYQSVFRMMNRDLMFAVTSMRTDANRTNEFFNKLIDSSNRTADEVRRLRAGERTTPSRGAI